LDKIDVHFVQKNRMIYHDRNYQYDAHAVTFLSDYCSL